MQDIRHLSIGFFWGKICHLWVLLKEEVYILIHKTIWLTSTWQCVYKVH